MSATCRAPLWIYVLLICLLPLLLPVAGLLISLLLWDKYLDTTMARRGRPARVTHSPILPPELWHIVFGEVGDQTTLLVCSLVCSAWAFITRDQLRLKMSLHDHQRKVQLIRLLHSPVQTLSRAAYCVSLKGGQFDEDLRIIRLLRLHTARLGSAIITGDLDVREWLLHFFPDSIVDLSFEPSVYKMCVCGGVHPTQELEDFLIAVSGFKNLRSLTLNIEYNEPLEVVYSATPLPITRLSVSGRWPSGLDSFFKGLVTLEFLEKTGWGREVISTEIMLRANADTLRHLHLTVPAMNAPLNLAIVKNLRSLVLILTSSSTECFNCTTHSLRSLRPLKEVTVKMADPFSWFYQREFSAISDILTGSRLCMTLERGWCYSNTLEFVGRRRSVQA